jgi:hypothetical protein
MRRPARFSSRWRADWREASRSRALLKGDREPQWRAVGVSSMRGGNVSSGGAESERGARMSVGARKAGEKREPARLRLQPLTIQRVYRSSASRGQ